MNNTYWGKTMEEMRDRVNIEFISNDQLPQIMTRQSKLNLKVVKIGNLH